MVIHHHNARARENFPVASWLVPKRVRAPIMGFYDFARGADDVADSPTLSAPEKLRQLGQLKRALIGRNEDIPDWAEHYVADIRQGLVGPQYGLNLLVAFMQDATKQHYATMEELKLYCKYSAAPVGRMVLDVCGEKKASRYSSDALSGALQLLNHIQDVKKDYEGLQRVYLPKKLLERYAVRRLALEGRKTGPSLRMVLDAVLDQADTWISHSRYLPTQLTSWRLRLEIALIWQIAKRLSRKLRTHDPLAKRVKLGPLDYTLCIVRAMPALWGRC